VTGAEIVTWVLSLVPATGLTTVGAVWLLKKSIEAKIREDVDTRLQSLKDTNARALEGYKDQLSSQSNLTLERAKVELDRARWYAQQAGTRRQEVYPVLFEQVRVAEGLTGSIWGFRRGGVDFRKLDADEIAAKLTELKVNNRARDEILKDLLEHRNEAYARLEEFARNAEIAKAEAANIELNNMVLTKALFLSPDVEARCWSIHKKLSAAWLDVHMAERVARSDPTYGEKWQPLMSEVATEIAELKGAMRDELQGPG
jgi:hypothetical protein